MILPLALSIWFLLMALAGRAQIITEDSDHVFIGNESLKFRFQKGDGRLTSVTQIPTGTEFIKATTNVWWAPFSFMYRINGQNQYVGGWVAKAFQYTGQTNAEGATLRLLWTGFNNGGADLDIRVGITVVVKSNSPLSAWSMTLTNQTTLAIEEVSFPAINGIGQISQNGNDDYLAYPSMGGLLFRNPLLNFRINRGWGWELFYPSLYGNMQFLTLYGGNPKAGLYLASADTNANSKFLNVGKPDETWMAFSINHRPEIVSSPGWNMSLDTVVGCFSGDWYDAARIYRDWALHQPWAAKGPVHSRADLPAWLKQVGLREWIFTHPLEYPVNPFSLVPEVLTDSATSLGCPVLAGWIGWERLGWYRAYPDVFPPKEGWASFSGTITAAQHADNYVGFIPCTTSYASLARDWNLAQAAACLDRDGAYLNPGEYLEYSAPVASNVVSTLYKMCPATPFWQEKLRSLLGGLATNRTDMIYLDGFPVFGPQPCMATNHAHPKGGGHWWTDNYLNLFEGIKEDLRHGNSRLAFSSEGFAETFLPLFDINWDPGTTGWSPASITDSFQDASAVQLIPLWHAVYHDYGLMESQFSFSTRNAPSGAVGYGDYRDFYIRGFALALVWGEMPCTWYCDEKMSQVDGLDEKEMVAYLRRIVQTRLTCAQPYLVYGRMLRPPAIDVPAFHIAGANPIPYTMANYPPFDEKTVLASAWKSPSGTTGFIFCNISHDPQSFRLPITPANTEFPATVVCSISENRNGLITSRANQVGLPCELLVQINPLDVLLIDVVAQVPSLHAATVPANIAAVPHLTVDGGLFGSSWTLERTTNLPAGPWTDLTTFSGANTQFTDYDATNHAAAFYRLKLPW